VGRAGIELICKRLK